MSENKIMVESKIKDIVENRRQELQVNIHDEILKMYAEKAAVETDKHYLIKCFEVCRMDRIDTSEIIGSKENTKRLLEEYRHIQNLIEKEYFSRY